MRFHCVLNLSPGKPQVWRELAAALIGCVAGAILAEETRRLAEMNANCGMASRLSFLDRMRVW